MKRRSGRRRVHAVLLAGGAGERFWPRSRRAHPKPFLSIAGGKTLLEATLARARRVGAPDRVWVVCGRDHTSAVRRLSGLPAGRVLAEPTSRNTAMAVGLAATMISREDPEALMAVLPADHVIPDGRAFATAIRRAAAAAATGVLVTLGVRPSRPDSSYGYIHAGVPAAGGFPGLYRVRRFVEKPDAARARRYLRQKGVFWNAGIFVWGAETILGEMERLAPDVHRCLSFLRDARTRERRGALERAYRHAPSLPIDVAVVERSRKVWVLPVDFHWSDVGTWASLAQELGVASGVTRVLDGDVMLDDAGGNLVWADGRLVVLLGVEGLAVVDSGDALLVTRLERSGEVRRVVERLRRRGRAELT